MSAFFFLISPHLWSSEVMVGMGFTPEEIKDALLNQKYNEVTATYLLLGLKNEVSSLGLATRGQHKISMCCYTEKHCSPSNQYVYWI